MSREFKSLIAILMLFVSSTSFAQQVKYVLTKSIDENGYEETYTGTKGDCMMLVFDGVYVDQKTEYGTPFPIPIRYKYHHREGANSVYYQSAIDMGTGREVINDTSVLVVSSDKSLINKIMFFRGRRLSTLVYQKLKSESYNQMIR